MFIVPIAGDRITTLEGLPAKVLSFTNYKAIGPAVIVEGDDGTSSETVFFQDIVKINDQKVRYTKNASAFKVFETDGYLKRTFQLPQPGSVIEAGKKMTVKRLKLHVKDNLSRGLILECLPQDSDITEEITLSQITGIDRELFSRSKFLAYYADYTEKGAV